MEHGEGYGVQRMTNLLKIQKQANVPHISSQILSVSIYVT